MIASLAMLWFGAAQSPAAVVVYPDRARVTRVQPLECGRAALAQFDGLPDGVDPASLRAQVSSGEVRGLFTEERTRAKAFSAQAQALHDQILALEQQRALAADGQAGHEDSATLSAAYLRTAAAGLGRELDAPPQTGRNLSTWQRALLDPLKLETEALDAAVSDAATLRSLDRRLEDLRAQAAKLEAASQHRERVAEVLFACPAGQRAQVALSYLVGGASWTPVYEARATPDRESVDFATYATVKQTTGEDWSAAKLTLSTAVPLTNATPPRIDPLELSAEERTPPKKVLATRTEVAAHAETGSGASAGRQGPGALAASDQGLSVQLAVPGVSEVPGDGTPVRLFVGRQALEAHLALRTSPALAPFVFRVADLTDEAPYPLLAGFVEIFWKGGFVGRQSLERVAAGAAFHLTIGLDDRFKVERSVIEEVKRDTGLFGSSHRLRYGYRIEVQSHASRPETVELAEQIPVSEIDDVKVAVEATTTPGFALQAEDGRLTWRLALPPGQARTVELHFHVDLPSEYDADQL